MKNQRDRQTALQGKRKYRMANNRQKSQRQASEKQNIEQIVKLTLLAQYPPKIDARRIIIDRRINLTDNNQKHDDTNDGTDNMLKNPGRGGNISCPG